MASTIYGDITPRTAAYAEKELLKRGIPYLVLEKFGQAKSLPDNSTKVIKFRRFNALDNTPVALSEGITPGSQPLSVTDITATLSQFGGLTTISDVIMDTHEDPVLKDAAGECGDNIVRTMEALAWGILRRLWCGFRRNGRFGFGFTRRCFDNSHFDRLLNLGVHFFNGCGQRLDCRRQFDDFFFKHFFPLYCQL
jgi:N4-gp56 family major capsid protein